jgi:hypothetical protein
MRAQPTHPTPVASGMTARHIGRRLSWRISLSSLLAGLWLVAGFTFAPTALGQARTAGTVSGVVVNGSSPVSGLAVTLQAVVSGTAKDAATTTSDQLGRFSFSGLDTTGLTSYAVYTHYQGGVFETPAITFTSGPSTTVTLQVFPTSSSDSSIQVASTTLLFSTPNQALGLLPVGVLMTMENSGTTAYVARVGPANGQPTNLLRFYLPPGAQDLTLGAGFSGLQVVQVDTGFGVTATLPPGRSAFAFAYNVPYSGTRSTFPFKAEYPSLNVVALIPPALQITGMGGASLQVKPLVKANGATYQVLSGENLHAGAQVSFGLGRLPLPGESPDIDFLQLVLVGVIILLLLIGLAITFLRRGALAVAFGWIPASLVSPSRLKARRLSQREAERKRLLRALLALEDKQAAGQIGPVAYSRQRAELRSALRPLVIRAGEEAGV